MTWGMFGSRAESLKFLKNCFLFAMEQIPNFLLRSSGSLLLWGPIWTSWLKRRSALLCEFLPLTFLLSTVLITMAEVISQWTRQTDLLVSPRREERANMLEMVKLLLLWQEPKTLGNVAVLRSNSSWRGMNQLSWILLETHGIGQSRFFAQYVLYILLQSTQWEITKHLEHDLFKSNRNFWYPWFYIALEERLRCIGNTRSFKDWSVQLNILLLLHFS